MEAAADGDAKYLYERYGFAQLTRSVAMAHAVPANRLESQPVGPIQSSSR